MEAVTAFLEGNDFEEMIRTAMTRFDFIVECGAAGGGYFAGGKDENRGMQYIYDFVRKDTLIRYNRELLSFEILKRGDKKWRVLKPRPDYKNEGYARAVFLGEGYFMDLESITKKEAEKILEERGYTESVSKDRVKEPEAMENKNHSGGRT